ncbi:MAG: enoyl-CoA hydratase-related protein [Deltaproteobacteria bacterium]|nr:enoyl-CoA hydratase-related protein [Deltaproteobacteria bacterium]
MTFTLDAPHKNALTIGTYEELRDGFRAVALDERLRVVVLTGANRNFCSGGHVKDIIGRLVNAGAEELRQFNELTMSTVQAMRAAPQIIVAAIDGVAVGGGAALALATDLRVASDRARLGFVFPKVGLCAGDMGVSWLLPRLVGHGRAAELLLLGSFIDARDALAIGLVNVVASEPELRQRTDALVEQLLQTPPEATKRTKILLNDTWVRGFDEHAAAEMTAQVECMQEPDFQEGYAAFTAKRVPRFGKR